MNEDTRSAVQPQIQANSSPLPDQAGAAIRTLLVAVGGFMAGKGWIDANIVAATVPVVMIIGPGIWSQIKARTHSQQMKGLALDPRVPDAAVTLKA